MAAVEAKSQKYWGNWGGPGYSGGQLYKPTSFPQGKALQKPSLDPLDELYKSHDLEYIIANTHPDPKTRRAIAHNADQKLIKNAEKLIALPGALSLPQQIMTIATVIAFRVKLQLSSYNIPHIKCPDTLKTAERELKKSELKTKKTLLSFSQSASEALAGLTSSIPTSSKATKKGLELFKNTVRSLMSMAGLEPNKINQTPLVLQCYVKAAKSLIENGPNIQIQALKPPTLQPNCLS